MSTNEPPIVEPVNAGELSPAQTLPSSRQSLRGATAAQARFDYQLDVSILAALQLLLISKAASRFVLEPANEKDLEADLQPNVPEILAHFRAWLAWIIAAILNAAYHPDRRYQAVTSA